MNTSTGELRKFMEGEKIPEGFTELTDDEARQAEEILGDQQAAILPQDHPLRKQVTNRLASAARPGPKTKRRQSRDSRKRNRRTK